jgi:hypothetical protein
MIGSIERLWRRLPASQRATLTMMLLVTGVHGSADPARRSTGYGGVLPVPNCPQSSSSGRIDPSLEQRRRDARAERGRVLYSAGHGPKASTSSPSRAARKIPCPERRVSQRHAPPTPPNS